MSSIPTTPKRVLNVMHNIPRRVKSGTLRATPRTRGKENAPPVPMPHPRPSRALTPPPADPEELAARWAPRDGQIVIKVWMPTTDDIWAFRVPEAESLAAFRGRVAAKVGFAVRLEGKTARTRVRVLKEEGVFRTWVNGRVRGGRNHLLTAHRT